MATIYRGFAQTISRLKFHINGRKRKMRRVKESPLSSMPRHQYIKQLPLPYLDYIEKFETLAMGTLLFHLLC